MSEFIFIFAISIIVLIFFPSLLRENFFRGVGIFIRKYSLLFRIVGAIGTIVGLVIWAQSQNSSSYTHKSSVYDENGNFVSTKKYSLQELKAMINAGNYPALGETTSERKSVAFKECINQASKIKAGVGDVLPSDTIVNSSLVYMIKVWTTDGAILITCNSVEQTMTVSTTPYL